MRFLPCSCGINRLAARSRSSDLALPLSSVRILRDERPKGDGAKMKDDSGSWVVFLAVCYFVYVGCSAAWHSKVRYGMQYGVAYDKVSKDNKPHHCDFFAAPIGEKNCHYDAVVQKQSVRTGVNPSGYPMVSYDDGKTWYPNNGDPPVKAEPASLSVTWQKVEE